MLVGNGVDLGMICLYYLQIESWIKDPPYAVFLRGYLSWNALVFLLNKDGVVLLIKEKNRQRLVITILLIQLSNLVAALTSKHIQIARPYNSNQYFFFLH